MTDTITRLLEDFYPEPEFCSESNLSLRKVRQDRALGKGPPWLKIGRKVYYHKNGARKWLESLIVQPVRNGKGR